MATIPVTRSPQVSAGVVRPVAAQQNFGDVRGAFGEREAAARKRDAQATAATAAALGKAGEQAGQAATTLAKANAKTAAALDKASRRISARNDALKTIRATSVAEAEVQALITAADAGGDLSLPENIAQLQNEIDQVFDKAERDFGESELPEGRLDFLADMAKKRATTKAALLEKGVVIGRAMMSAELQKVVNKLSATVGSNPVALPDAQAEIEEFFRTKFNPAMPVEEQVVQRRAAMETVSTAAIDFLINARQYDDALARMNDPTIRPHLGDTRSRQLRLKIFDGQRIAQKVRVEAEVKLDIIRDAGVTITPEIAVAAVTGVNLTRTKGPRTTADKVLEFEQVMAKATGNPDFAASADQVAKIAGATVAEDRPFGEGFRGSMLQFMTENSDAFAAGTLSPGDFNFMITMGGAIQAVDEITGTRFEMPANLRAAFAAQGISPRQLTTPEGVDEVLAARSRLGATVAPVGTPGGGEPETAELSEAGQEKLAALGDKLAILESAAKSVDPGADETAETTALAETGINFYDMAGDLTGIFTGFKLAVSDFDPLSRFINFPAVVKARQQFAVLENSLAFIFRETERFADAERQNLKEKITAVQTGFFKSPGTLQSEMIGLDDVLRVFQANFEESIAKEGEVSGTRARGMLDKVNRLKLVRKLLGVPVMVRDEAALKDLLEKGTVKSGDMVRTPDTDVLSQVE